MPDLGKVVRTFCVLIIMHNIRSEMPASSVACMWTVKCVYEGHLRLQGVKLNGAFKSNFRRLRRAGTPPPLIIGVGLEVFATPLLSPNPVKYMYPPIDSRKAAENYHFTANGYNSY